MKVQLQNDWTLAHFISYIAAITAVLLVIQLIIQIVVFSNFGMEFPVKFSVENSEQQSTFVINGLTLIPDQQQEGRLLVLEVENRSDIHSFFLVSLKIVERGMFIFCAFLVWQIFRAVARNQPFSRGNYKRLFIIGWIFVLAEIIVLSRAFYLEWLTFDAFSSEPFKLIRTTDNLSIFLIMGIVIIVISYVFKEGHRIYEEQKLTV